MTPTIYRTRNLAVRVYPKDHNPPHVHVIGPNSEAKFMLDNMECVFSRGFTPRALKLIRDFLLTRKEGLLEAWDEFQD